MKITQTIKTSATSIRTHIGRSLLTVLGIVIAISAIVFIASIGRGAEALILNEVSGLGAQTIVIRPGKEPSGPTDIIDTIFADSITDRDIAALKKGSNVQGIANISPVVFVTGSASYEGETFKPQIFGWSAEVIADMLNVVPASGRIFFEDEIRSRASVAVIGSKVKDELFFNEDPLGKNIKVKGKNFRVIGVYEPKGKVAFLNVDELVLLPYSTAQKSLLGISHYHEVIVQAEESVKVSQIVRDIESTMRESHGITDPEKDDFFVTTPAQAAAQIQSITRALTAFLTSVVAIALAVGGIGVMNIMLVSVTERTQEIGLRKAIGATPNNIMFQFLVESTVLTLIGGVIGVLVGAGFGFLASFMLSNYLSLVWVFSFPVGITILAFVISALVGIVFGLYPAYQAAKKHPIEALRYE